VIVVDASAVLEIVLRSPAGVLVEQRLFDVPGQTVHAPHLLDIEVAQVLRRYERGGEIDADRGRAAIDDLTNLPLDRYPHDFLLPRVWQLRDNLTAYDAVYVALAEVLDAPLVTRDKRLASAPGHNAFVDLV